MKKNVAIEKSKPSHALTDRTAYMQQAHTPRTKNLYAASIGDENLASIAAVGHHRHADEDQVCFCALFLFLLFGRNFLGLLKVRVLVLNLS